MVGDRLREARHSQQLSLAEVAGRANISAATLSRIETNKQSVDLGLFLNLARILRSMPQELIEDADGERSDSDPLVRRIASLKPPERAKMWRELANERRGQKKGRSDVGQHFDELLAQFEYLRGEIEAVRLRLRKR